LFKIQSLSKLSIMSSSQN